MRLKNRDFETFGDGILSICIVKEHCIAGTKQEKIRFGNKTVGISRFYQAKVASDMISRMVAIPYIPEISQTDLVIIEGVQYKISQIQNKFDAKPPCLYLSLSESPIHYKDERRQ